MEVTARFRKGRSAGLDARSVGNLIAYSMGLPRVPSGWTARELAWVAYLAHQYDRDLSAGLEGVVAVNEPRFRPLKGACVEARCQSMPRHPRHLR